MPSTIAPLTFHPCCHVLLDAFCSVLEAAICALAILSLASIIIIRSRRWDDFAANHLFDKVNATISLSASIAWQSQQSQQNHPFTVAGRVSPSTYTWRNRLNPRQPLCHLEMMMYRFRSYYDVTFVWADSCQTHRRSQWAVCLNKIQISFD